MFRISSGLPPVSPSAHDGTVAAPPSVSEDAPAPASGSNEATETVSALSATAWDDDDVMRRVYANNAGRALHKDMWGEIAHFLPRNDILNLRSTSVDLSQWVDKAITSFKVDAYNAATTLRAISDATGFQHMVTVKIENCSNHNLPGVIAALAELPHARLHIVLTRDKSAGAFDQHGLAPLANIAPASVRLCDTGALSSAAVVLLATLTYPIHLTTGFPRVFTDNEALRALASIPQLQTLEVSAMTGCDDAMQILAAHPRLTSLNLISDWAAPIAISSPAFIALASSATLRSLSVHVSSRPVGQALTNALASNCTLDELYCGVDEPFSDDALAMALSKNTTLKTLSVSMLDGWRHLANMPSLERLYICGKVSRDDAQAFARDARLKELVCAGNSFESGALEAILSSTVERMSIYHTKVPIPSGMNDAAIRAIMQNEALRHLAMALSVESRAVITDAIRLAGHPTLTSLRILYLVKSVAESHADLDVTQAERDTLLERWGRHRPADALQLDIA